jgi:hypothetical protein
MRIHRLTTSLSVFVLFTVSFCVAASAAENIRFVDVVSIDWNGSSQRKVSVSDVVKSLEETSLPYWNNQVKYSKLDNRIIKLGEVFYREIVVKNPPSCSGNLANEYIRKVRLMLESAESTSSNFDQRYLVVLMPRINCIWEAISTLNTPGMWMGGMLLNDVSKNFIISHELGHALGLGHSNLVACDAGKFDGIWLKECRGIEYGGAVDLMGNIEVNTPLSTYHKWRLGIITNRQVKQNWLNETVILSDTESPDGIRALFIRDVKASYWIEFRKSSLNNLDKPGLVIYRVDPPPASAIYSPNTQDSTDDETDMRVSTDIWMLNLDDFQYSNGVATGSMTLPTNRLFSTFSSNITLSYELLSPDRVAIKIMRKPDLTSPPVPELLPESQWTNPQASILRMGNNYEDAESVISEYEVEMGGTITKISTPSPEFIPNYLSLLSAQKTILFGDLKEGDYMIRVRAVDIWGNKSYWSELKRVSIDKSFPILKILIYATSD